MVKAIESFSRWAISVNMEGIIITGLACLIVGYVFCDVLHAMKKD